MEPSPIPRNGTVSDAVFTRLVDEILSGRWPAEQPAPSERDLALAWQVNRHSVREALKRLQQAGLVKIGQGGKTQVLDWRSHAGLDMGFALVAAGVMPLSGIFTDTAVLRRTVGVDAARLCALKASDQEIAEVTAAAAAYPRTGTLDAFQAADIAFWTAIVIGSGNIAYRLALNTLMRAIEDVGAQLVMGLNAEVLTDRGGHLELAAAIVDRDADTAARLAYAQLSELVDLFPSEA